MLMATAFLLVLYGTAFAACPEADPPIKVPCFEEPTSQPSLHPLYLQYTPPLVCTWQPVDAESEYQGYSYNDLMYPAPPPPSPCDINAMVSFCNSEEFLGLQGALLWVCTASSLSVPYIPSSFDATATGTSDGMSALALLSTIKWFVIILGILTLAACFVSVCSVVGALVVLTRARRFAPFALAIHVKENSISKEKTKETTGEDVSEPGRQVEATQLVPLELAVGRVLQDLSTGSNRPADQDTNKFKINKLIAGRPVDSALGVMRYMHVDETKVYLGLAKGLESIQLEFETHGTEDDKLCLRYILFERTGDSTRQWSNEVMDKGHLAGLSLDDFVAHENSVVAGLSHAHVAALRLYTCNAFRSINNMLRQGHDQPYPFPVTLLLITDAIRKLRAVGAQQPDANEPLDLWRGMKNIEIEGDFIGAGGTEVALMSTTTDLRVAVSYSVGFDPSSATRALLFKLRAESFMDRGADLSYLSCFPAEVEMAFPPLTYLAPSGRREVFKVSGIEFECIEVEPRFSS